MIDEADDSLTTLLHLESWSRNHAIVTNMACFDARVDFDIDRLDINFVVINVIIGSNRRQMLILVCRMYADLLT